MKNSKFIPDESQKRVIEAQEGEFLVLAPPGCGKTQILTERICEAHKRGIDYGDMLCLTFTNRAARGMKERIAERIGESEVERIYVGNIHRFCSRFIFENGLVPAESSVIDDDDIISIIARFENEDEATVSGSFKRRKEYFAVAHLAVFMFQIQQSHPKSLRINADCITADDIKALKVISSVQKMEFSPSMMADVYEHAADFRDICRSDAYSYDAQRVIMPMLRKMEMAHYYNRYKEENKLLDFNDLLVLTYDTLAADHEKKFKRYSWCQVDEVQDLNPLQIKIIDLLSPTGNKMFLGDEQQAIFSFLGAKMSVLSQLKERCRGRLFHLKVNHRSPRYLLDVFNTYAEQILGIDSSMLPQTDYQPRRVGNELAVFCSSTFDNEFGDVTQQAQRLCSKNPSETTAVIVLSNADADNIGARMTQMGLPHFKVSGTDMFSLPEIKLLLAHLSVFANEHNFMAWARLLKGLHVYEQSAAARAFVRQLFDCGMLPTDLMFRPGSSYVIDFLNLCEGRDVVVFDTETTGLNVLDDEIVQIAAVKMRDGAIVPGSELSLHLETDKEIPLMLGSIENPIIEERKRQKIWPRREAFEKFVDYIGDAVLVGHNVEFDYQILLHNFPSPRLESKCEAVFDTLKLCRLLFPGLRQYKLKHLLEVFNLAGTNSHLADDDVAATCNVLTLCFAKAKVIVPQQRELLSQRTLKERAEQIRRKISPIYKATQSRLYEKEDFNGDLKTDALIVSELRMFYNSLLSEATIQPVRNVEYFFRYLNQEMINRHRDNYLLEQIAMNIIEMTTLKESDLCQTDIVDERIFVTTVHKAKGLEFDNVIIFDTASDRYPSYYATGNPELESEDARKLYVALTRARKRILLLVAGQRFICGKERTCGWSKFLKPVLPYFGV